jgi:hypothetical protein
MAKYKTRPGNVLPVQGRRVTDDPEGVELRETSGVLDHVRHGRLLPAEPQQKAPLKRAKEE